MALHIQMSEEAEAELRKAALRTKISSTLACLIFMLLGGGILYLTAVFIVQEIPSVFMAYTPPADDAPPTSNPVTQELTQRSAPSAQNIAPSVITAVNATNAAMAPVNINMTDGLDMDASLDVGLDAGLDLGAGLGSDGSGLGSSKSGGSALEGTFYDFKLTRSGASTGLKAVKTGNEWHLEGGRGKVLPLICDFLKNWNASSLGKYYASPTKLYASNFYLPAANAAYAPIAYQCADKCKPAAWLVVYRGKVRAPKSGKFRFIGTGDDFLAVRFNRKMVLEAGYLLPSMWDKIKGDEGAKSNYCWVSVSNAARQKEYMQSLAEGKDKDHKGYEFIKSVKEAGIWNRELGGLTAGTIFDVKEGQTYPIEIAISEIPGGAFGYVLFIEDVTDGKNSKAPKYDLFRTNFSMPKAADIKKMLEEAKCVRGGVENIPYNEDSLIWTAVP